MTSSVGSSLDGNHWQHVKYVIVILNNKETRKHYSIEQYFKLSIWKDVIGNLLLDTSLFKIFYYV